MLKKYPFSASAALKEPIVSEMFPCVVAKGSSRETIFDLLSVSDAEEETRWDFLRDKASNAAFSIQNSLLFQIFNRPLCCDAAYLILLREHFFRAEHGIGRKLSGADAL